MSKHFSKIRLDLYLDNIYVFDYWKKGCVILGPSDIFFNKEYDNDRYATAKLESLHFICLIFVNDVVRAMLSLGLVGCCPRIYRTCEGLYFRYCLFTFIFDRSDKKSCTLHGPLISNWKVYQFLLHMERWMTRTEFGHCVKIFYPHQIQLNVRKTTV